MTAIVHYKRAVPAIMTIVLLFTACRVYHAPKQVRTVADMQRMCALIEAEKERHRPIDEATIRILVSKVEGGRAGGGMRFSAGRSGQLLNQRMGHLK